MGQRWCRRELQNDVWDVVEICGVERVQEVVEPIIRPVAHGDSPMRVDVESFTAAYTTIGVRQRDPDAKHYPWGTVAGPGRLRERDDEAEPATGYSDLLEPSATEQALIRLERLR